MASGPEETDERIAEFQAFLDNRLLPDLHAAEAARDALTGEYRVYEELRDLVKKLQKVVTTALRSTTLRILPAGSTAASVLPNHERSLRHNCR